MNFYSYICLHIVTDGTLEARWKDVALDLKALTRLIVKDLLNGPVAGLFIQTSWKMEWYMSRHVGTKGRVIHFMSMCTHCSIQILLSNFLDRKKKSSVS
jgi:hypothetical protein